MNWDWEKLQQKRHRQPGGGGGGPNLGDFNLDLNKFKRFRFPAWKLMLVAVVIFWILSGIYIVEPDEVGVVLRFGKYSEQTTSGIHYHLPYPVERVETPKVTIIRREEVGFRTIGRSNVQSTVGQVRMVPEESLMLTGDENIVDVQFIVQYLIKDPVAYLFNVAGQSKTVMAAAEAAMREVVGKNKIDSVLTTDKLVIQNACRDLMQEILDIYQAGMQVVAVQLQDVHPPKEVIDAFKDVASAREDKSRFINEADAYRNDLLPKARGEAAAMVNQAEAYKEGSIRRAKGEASRFVALLNEYNKAKEVTRRRLFIETMERILANPDLEKIVLSDKAARGVLPYLPLDRLPKGKGGTQ